MSGHRLLGWSILFSVVVAMVVATQGMPYSYYMFLKVLTCAASVYYLAMLKPSEGMMWALIGIIVLYNPVLPVYLGVKWVWTLLNIGTVICFWVVQHEGIEK